MTVHQYGTVASPSLVNAELELLKHAESVMVLGGFGMQKAQPLRKTDTILFSRLNPYGMAANGTPTIASNNFILSEGVVPKANVASYTTVSTQLQQFGVLYKLTDKTVLMHEYDIPEDMKKLTGDTLGEVAEMACYGQVRGGTSVIRANGSTRAAINTTIKLDHLRLASRTIQTNRGKPVTKAINPGPNFGTSGISPSFLVFHHTDMTADLQNLPKFVDKINYGSAIKPVHEREHGYCNGFRFIESPLFTPFLAQGAAVGATGMVAANATNIDVYPLIVMAEDAWGHVSLKGHDYKTGIAPRVVSPHVISAANPLGQVGYVGASMWYAPVRLNENWMIRIECAASALT